MDHIRIARLGSCESQSNQPATKVLEILEDQLDQLRLHLLNQNDRQSSQTTPAGLGRLVQEIVRSRRRREKFFDDDLFGEPAWDILLELYASEQAHRKLSVSGICYASAVPSTTGLRWIERLERQGWLTRVDDPGDGRRTWITLTEKASGAMTQYLGDLAVRLA